MRCDDERYAPQLQTCNCYVLFEFGHPVVRSELTYGCFRSPTRQAGKYHSPCLVLGRAETRSSPAMPQRMSGRSYPLRWRAASSVASFDAPSTAARAALSVSASCYSPLAPAPADQRNQAKEDAEEEEAGAVVGGKVNGDVLSSTDSGVRVGQTVHSVQSAVGPVRRSASDTATWSNAADTRPSSTHPARMVSLAATGLTLTPTSTPTEIYTLITSLTELRRQANLFEAALSNQQPDGGKQHSTCFKLYQAVRSAKKRDNKKRQDERQFGTLEDAFNAHRSKALRGCRRRNACRARMHLLPRRPVDRSHRRIARTTSPPLCLLPPLTPLPPHHRPLVCVERLAASMWTRRCVSAHKLACVPRPLRPTASPLPPSLTMG